MASSPKLERTPAIQTDDLLTAEQLAQKLQVKLSWVWEQTRSRNRSKDPLPAIYLSPKVVRFSWAQVSVWIQSKG